MNRNIIVGIVSLAVMGGIFWLFSGNGEDSPDTLSPPPVSDQLNTASRDGESPDSQVLPASPPESAPLREGGLVSAPTPPSFDIVRVGPDGRAVLAGRAAPGAEVDIYDGANLLATVEADARGEWVWIPAEAFAPGQVELTLRARGGEGRDSESSQAVLMLLPERKPGVSQSPLIVKVDQAGEGPSELIQLPSGRSGVVNLSLDTVDYDVNGILILSGRAIPGSVLRLRLGDTVSGETRADDQGRWSLSPPNPVAPGDYLLRLDRLTADDQVAETLELPFHRADEKDLARDFGSGQGNWIVQPGNSLWRIARRIYGQGARFTVIYEANKSQISDPDLIYPGQVFSAPPVP